MLFRSPVSATDWCGGALHVRLSGAESAVATGLARIGGVRLAEPSAEAFWADLREQRSAFFAGDAPLWRLSVRSNAAPLALPGEALLEWGGALRWWRGECDAARAREAAAQGGGHATRFRGGERSATFAPLAPALERLHHRLKAAFDPAGILNRGRLYPGF